MANGNRNVILIGPMGAGKSTIGKRLAAALGREFVDCDRAIEEQTGASIPLIFDIEGEAGFRARERAMLERLTGVAGRVLATGGGAILDPDNRRRLRGSGTVIYLACSVDQQYARTRYSKHRPLLRAADPVGRLEALYREREPLYRQTAHLVIDTDHRSVKSVVRELVRLLDSRGDDDGADDRDGTDGVRPGKGA